jgi:pyruvate formate lyase activating enzyme
MRIGGLQKSSLIDYPGKVSSVIFCSGCNFDCPYCHNPELVTGRGSCPADFSDEKVFDFLQQRVGFLDGVVISGGEPTLQKDLVDTCTRVKALGYPVKLDTNGSRPQVLRRLIEEDLVDYIAMDLKTDPLQYKSYINHDCNPSALFASIQMIMDSGKDYEFRTTCVKPIVTPPAIEGLARLIQGARLYVLQRFRDTQVLHPEFFENRDCQYRPDEMLQLKTVAEKWVSRCRVR